MSADKYPSIFSPELETIVYLFLREMEAIVFIILQVFFALRAILKGEEYHSDVLTGEYSLTWRV